MIRMLRPALGLMLAAFLLAAPPKAFSAPGPRPLTSTGDVLMFAWAASSDALYITRAGETLNVSTTTRQITGEVYRVGLDAQSELLARNANHVAPAPAGRTIAFTRLGTHGAADLYVADVASRREQRVGAVDWGIQPQWSGDELLYVRGGVVSWNATGRHRVLTSTPIPRDAVISPRGDAAAYVATDGLWLWSNAAIRRVYETTGDARIQYDLRWSNRGDRLVFILTHGGLEPELWQYDLPSGAADRLAGGQLEHFAVPQWSPDDAFVIWTRVPTASSAANESEIWRAASDGGDARALTHNRDEDALAQYSPDASKIAFIRDGNVWIAELDAQGLPRELTAARSNLILPQPPSGTAAGQLAPPATIRVRHDAANTCRNVPVGQIDTLDFESYVKRVVPAEVFATWRPEALKAQAVAARSYAWYFVLQHTGWGYDVTDSTSYQYMCDTRYASTDAAVDATRGQYCAYSGYVIFAAYGAENGDPTLTNTWGNPYLIAVDDPVGFGRTRAGNGLGMSQWGAQRWALGYSWNYQQILTHYYTGITVEAPAGASPDSDPPIGAVIEPWSEWGVVGNRVQLVINASDDSGELSTVELRAHYFDGTSLRDETLASLEGSVRSYLWDVSALPDQTGVVVTLFLRDPSGNESLGNGVQFDLDRQSPQGSITAPTSTLDPTITVHLSASDSSLRGVAMMAFSNNWIWEGENQYVEKNSGSVVADPDALNGSALRGMVGTNPPGEWYGPYTSILPTTAPYRAYFRLKTDDPTETDEIALLDVVSNGGDNILGLKRLRGADFRSAKAYQEFYVDFYSPAGTSQSLEFRVAFRAAASLWLDRMLIVAYPIPYSGTAEWTLPARNGSKMVQGKFLDGSGNASPDATASIYLGALPSPTPTLLPRQWLPFIVR